MKKILFIITIALFFKPIFPVIEYAVNYEYISKVLCVNKDKPMMHCNGKCHLMKELAKAAESEKPISSDKKNNNKQETEVLFCHDIFPLIPNSMCFENAILIGDNYSNLYFYLNGFPVFHPPALA